MSAAVGNGVKVGPGSVFVRGTTEKRPRYEVVRSSAAMTKIFCIVGTTMVVSLSACGWHDGGGEYETTNVVASVSDERLCLDRLDSKMDAPDVRCFTPVGVEGASDLRAGTCVRVTRRKESATAVRVRRLNHSECAVADDDHTPSTSDPDQPPSGSVTTDR
jgi:hypothetical protein